MSFATFFLPNLGANIVLLIIFVVIGVALLIASRFTPFNWMEKIVQLAGWISILFGLSAWLLYSIVQDFLDLLASNRLLVGIVVAVFLFGFYLFRDDIFGVKK